MDELETDLAITGRAYRRRFAIIDEDRTNTVYIS